MVSLLTAPYVAALVKSVTSEVDRLPSLGKVSLKNRRLFAVDLSLVALAIRTGYLVDTVAPQDAKDVFSRLLSALRTAYPIFETVVHIYEPASDQSFFVNMPMLSRYIQEVSALTRSENGSQRDETYKGNAPSFVRLHPKQRCEFLAAPPAGLISILQFLVDDLVSLPVSKTLPSALSQDILVPMAAMLIEYPVAYVPTSSDQGSFLSNVPLDVYECVLTFDKSPQFPNPHTLLKFSCPSDLATHHADILGSSRIIENLVAKFQPRIHKISSGAELIVRQSVEIVDRVAL